MSAGGVVGCAVASVDGVGGCAAASAGRLDGRNLAEGNRSNSVIGCFYVCGSWEIIGAVCVWWLFHWVSGWGELSGSLYV